MPPASSCCFGFLILYAARPAGLCLQGGSLLAGETLFLSDEDNCFLPEIRSCLLRAGIDATWRRMSSYRVLMPFVEMGQGLTFMPRQMPDMKNVVFRRFELDRAQSIVLCSLKTRQGAQLHRGLQIIRCAVASVYGEP